MGNSQYDRDLAYLKAMHKMSKATLGMSDAEIKKIAKTNGNIHPEAMRDYLKSTPETQS